MKRARRWWRRITKEGWDATGGPWPTRSSSPMTGQSFSSMACATFATGASTSPLTTTRTVSSSGRRWRSGRYWGAFPYMGSGDFEYAMRASGGARFGSRRHGSSVPATEAWGSAAVLPRPNFKLLTPPPPPFPPSINPISPSLTHPLPHRELPVRLLAVDGGPIPPPPLGKGGRGPLLHRPRHPHGGALPLGRRRADRGRVEGGTIRGADGGGGRPGTADASPRRGLALRGGGGQPVPLRGGRPVPALGRWIRRQVRSGSGRIGEHRRVTWTQWDEGGEDLDTHLQNGCSEPHPVLARSTLVAPTQIYIYI